MDTPADIRQGTYIYPAKAKNLDVMGFPHAREWAVEDIDWTLPEDWQRIVLEGMADRLAKYRSFKIFMDTCVRCGACADKCHFFLGSGDPKNMPVLRAELLRAVYRKDFTMMGKIFGQMAHVSQYFEWLPWVDRRLDEVPEDPAQRREWFIAWRGRPNISPEMRQNLEKWYSADKARNAVHAEAFEIAEYGYQPSDEEIRRMFPMLGQ